MGRLVACNLVGLRVVGDFVRGTVGAVGWAVLGGSVDITNQNKKSRNFVEIQFEKDEKNEKDTRTGWQSFIRLQFSLLESLTSSYQSLQMQRFPQALWKS